MTAAIAIRDQTRDDLQKLAKRANETQDDAEVSLSDVIDALLSLSEVDDARDAGDEVLEEIIHIAKKN